MMGKLARRSVDSNANRLLRYQSHFCSVSVFKVLFKSYRCPSYYNFFSGAPNWERHLTPSSGRMKHVYPRNCLTHSIPDTDNQQLLSNRAVFDFQTTCGEHEDFLDTETRTWIGKHFAISEGISSNWTHEHIFLCNLNPRDLVSSFIDALEKLDTQSKLHLKRNFFEIETTTKSRLARILEVLNQRRSHSVGIEAEEDNSKISSTNFLQMHKNQLLDLQEGFESFCNALPVFDFQTAR